MKVRLLVTSSCPARCVGCHNEHQDENHLGNIPKFINLDSVKEMMTRLYNMNRLPNEVVISGGEPSLFNELGELAKFLRNIGVPYISLNSNCLGWSNVLDSFDWINEIKVHIEDVPHKDNMNAYSDTIGLSNSVLENIKKIPSLLKQGQASYINTIMRSQQQVKRIIDFSIEHGFNTKLIEESLVTTNKVSYSKEECIDYLISNQYISHTNNHIFKSLVNDHKVNLRQCLSSCELFITINHIGLVRLVHLVHDSRYKTEEEVCDISQFHLSSIF